MLETIVLLAAVTFSLGILLGFIGAGGAGILLGILTAGFDLPIQQAIGTSIATMFCVTISGAISHYREGNVAPRLGLAVGLSGAAGAIVGAELSQDVPPEFLKVGAGLALWMLASMVWYRTRMTNSKEVELLLPPPRSPGKELGICATLGLAGGSSAAFFGVGMAPFLQLGFLTALRLSLRQTIGTTMMALVFIAGAATVVLGGHGDISYEHLAGAVIGTASGSYIGARFTGNAPRNLLRFALVATPILAGALVIFG